MRNLTKEQRQKAKMRIDRAIEELPLLPSAVCELMALSVSDETYFEKVEHLAQQDPTFAIRLIRLANSAASAPISQITSLHHAIARIGTRHIKGLATAFAVTKIFVPSNKSERDIWLHSIQVAVASQSIARMATQLNVNLETAYLCGLLHDIGRFVLFNLVPDSILRIDEKDWDSPEELIDAEEDAIGTDHAKLGAYTAKKWTLPDKLVNVICNHHNYTYSETTQVDKYDASLVKIVQIADSFSVLLMKHPDSLSLPPKELEELIEQHCFHPSWEDRPIKAILLQNEAQKIYDKSLDLANGLGIMIDN